MVQRKNCRLRQELSNEYLLAKIGFDTAKNELFQGPRMYALKDPVGDTKFPAASAVTKQSLDAFKRFAHVGYVFQKNFTPHLFRTC